MKNITYYEHDSIFFAKEGGLYSNNDIYKYNYSKKCWVRYIWRDDIEIWEDLNRVIWDKCYSINEIVLGEKDVPLLKLDENRDVVKSN